MALRRGFLRSLKDDAPESCHVDASASSSMPSSIPADTRRSFLASLKDDADTGGQQDHSVVDFNVKNLKDFQCKNRSMTSFKKMPSPPLKRPNYDSSKRKFFANPLERLKFPGSSFSPAKLCFLFNFKEASSHTYASQGSHAFSVGKATMVSVTIELDSSIQEIAANVIGNIVFTA